ncbi:helix-turn-helix transcriptional regulator [Halalkalibacterium ligniniphilum]|uniref:helix-turn-helix transcriptional regulator n=1 Tax=Halalkalibacterium ligniniphilum TaxID=1134413 RepID=UPI00034D8094|nr:metalloregulator ArsR/SmtB family transcription factor [Halalkalibacterium ligniniphilum]
MSNKTTSTRDMIMKGLKKHKERSVGEIARELEITEMAVRRHINSLEKDGFIKTTLVRQAMGRPATKYSLTSKGEEQFPRNYNQLSLGILEDLEAINGNELIDQLFERRKERLKKMYEVEMEHDSFEKRVATLAAIQNDNGYMVEWEQLDEETYRFTEYNCPISQVAKAYPVACSCEQKLFRELLKTEGVIAENCAAKEDVPHCVYTFKKPKDSK